MPRELDFSATSPLGTTYLVQIAVGKFDGEDGLFGLDSDGCVWAFDANAEEWVALPTDSRVPK